MKTPVFRFEAEVLTDAPLDRVIGALRDPGPQGFRSLRALKGWQAPEPGTGPGLDLCWTSVLGGTEESGRLSVSPDPRGAHLRLEGQLRGWLGFLLLGWLRWRTDRILDRFVEEL